MFFDYSLLNRRNGKFSLIWLVVNDRIEYRRRTDKNFREVMAVDVPKTCEDIIRYICAQVPSRGPGSARPRFSLYLSSMLMAGSVRVYRHQTCLLLSDAAAAFEKLMKTSYMSGSLEDDPVNVRRVTLMVDPLELVPSGDPFQLGSLYDIDTMLQLGPMAADRPPEGEGEPAPGRQPPPYNPNVARVSDITLREEDRTERQQHLLEDFGESLLPHQRPLVQPQLEPLLELELELAAAGRREMEQAVPPPPPPPPGRLSVQEEEQLVGPPPTCRPRVSQPDQDLLLNAATRAVHPRLAGDEEDVPLLGALEKVPGPPPSAAGEAPPPPPPPAAGEAPPPPPPPAGEAPPPPPPPGGEEMPPPPPPAAAEDAQRTVPRRRTRVPPPAGEEAPPRPEERPPPPTAEQQPPPSVTEDQPPQPPTGDTTLPTAQAPPATFQAELEATPQRAGEPPTAERPSRRRAPPAADVTIEGPPPPAGSADGQRQSEISSSLQLPEEVAPPPPVRLGRRRRLAVDSTIQLDREAFRRRIEEGSYDTMRAATATEDNAPAASERLTAAAELLGVPGRPVGGVLALLHRRHCVTQQEEDWSWRPDGRQEPGEPQRPREEGLQPPEPEVQRDRTATASGTGSLLSASDLPSARSSAGQQLSFMGETSAVTVENLPIIAEAQEQTPAAQPPPPPPPPVVEPQLPPVVEPQLPPVVEPQLPAVVEPQLPPVVEPQLPPVVEPQLPPVVEPQLPPVVEPQLPPVEEQQLVPPVVEQPPPPPPPPPPGQEPPPPPPPPEEAQPAPAATPADSGVPGGSSGRTGSSEEAPPTQSPPLTYGSGGQFRSASLIPEDVVALLRDSPAGWLPFSELAPPSSSSRQQAAATFAHLLQLHARKVVVLRQERPYAEIAVHPAA